MIFYTHLAKLFLRYAVIIKTATNIPIFILMYHFFAVVTCTSIKVYF